MFDCRSSKGESPRPVEPAIRHAVPGSRCGERRPLPSTPRPPNFESRPFKIVLLFLALGLSGCGYYSFTGASIAPHLETVAIPLAENRTASPITDLDSRLTDLLVDRFVGQTRLSLEPEEAEADVVLSTVIDRYTNQPTSVSGDVQAARNRVTITVTVRYFDRVENRELLAQSFSGYSEYLPLDEGLAGEGRAAMEALENVADDIFTAATSDW